MSRLEFKCDRDTFDKFEESLAARHRFVSLGILTSEEFIKGPRKILVPIIGVLMVDWPVLICEEVVNGE